MLYKPMLCKSLPISALEKMEGDPDIVAGEKFDGFREMLEIDSEGKIRIFSRSGKEHTDLVPHITDIRVPELADTVLDCEGVGPMNDVRSTKSVFGSLPRHSQEYQQQHGKGRLIAFDILKYRGVNSYEYPFYERRMALTDVEKDLVSAGIYYVISESIIQSHFQDHFDAIIAAGGEGVILKRLSAPYSPGERTDAWYKVKKVNTWDVVITGFTKGRGKYSEVIGAMRFGFWKDGRVVETGRTSGMTDNDRCVFAFAPDFYIGQVAEVKGQELGKDGAIRFPSFVRLRDDKKAEECLFP